MTSPVNSLQNYPGKTIINGEPAYEDHPVNWRPVNGWFDDWDSRQAAYWSVFNGTKGHVFGNHNTWQMWEHTKDPISSARTHWRSALNYPAAWQIGYLGKLMMANQFQHFSLVMICLLTQLTPVAVSSFASPAS